MRLGIERERHRESECDRAIKARQNPFVPLIDGHDRCSDLDDEPCNRCVAQRDTIDLPLFQLTEERAHLCPVAYVVSAIPIITSSLESQGSFVRQYEVRIRLIPTGQTL
jgi:hypothetical protein